MIMNIVYRNMVVFDLDDTLHMRAEPFARTVGELFGITGEQLLGKMFTDFRAIGVEYFHQWDAGTISEQEMYIRRTIDTFALYDRKLTREESAHFHETYGKYLQQIRPAEGIGAMLQTAADMGIGLGVLTNGSPVRQRDKIRALGLSRWIPEEHIAVSLELGVHKPDPEVFLKAAEYLGFDPKDCLVVEDAENGILAARAAGMQCVGFDGSQLPSDLRSAPFVFSDYRQVGPADFFDWYKKLTNH